MRRLVDLFLITVLLGAAGFGAYLIGHHVDHLSNQASAQDSELNGTTTLGSAANTAGHAPRSTGTHITPLLVGGALLAMLLAVVLAGLINALVKSRRRQRWRFSS